MYINQTGALVGRLVTIMTKTQSELNCRMIYHPLKWWKSVSFQRIQSFLPLCTVFYQWRLSPLVLSGLLWQVARHMWKHKFICQTRRLTISVRLLSISVSCEDVRWGTCFSTRYWDRELSFAEIRTLQWCCSEPLPPKSLWALVSLVARRKQRIWFQWSRRLF